MNRPPPRLGSARFQFTIQELFTFMAFAFIGMKLSTLVFFEESPGLGCALAIVATSFGGYLGQSCNRYFIPRQIRWLLAGIIFGWLFSFWIGCIVYSLHRGYSADAVWTFILGGPIAIPFLIAFIYFPKAERESWKVKPAIMIPWLMLFSFGLVALMAIPSLFQSRHPYNECAPAAACRAYAEAQEIYRRTDYSHTGLQYAMSLRSLLGTSGELALIDKAFAKAEYGGRNMSPKAGYYFKVLTAQGPHATGGSRSYIDLKGRMTLGYALLAFPSTYDVTECDSYIINHNGTIFQKDLGPNTAQIAPLMTEFDPDTTWVPTQ